MATNAANYLNHLKTLSIDELVDMRDFSSERRSLRDCVEWRVGAFTRAKAIHEAILAKDAEAFPLNIPDEATLDAMAFAALWEG